MAYPAGSIVAYITLNTHAWDRSIGSVRGDIGRLTHLSEGLGRRFLALSASIVGVGAIAVREFGKFEHAMRIATSVSNVSEKEFAQASDKAIEVSKKWNVAATTVANAYLYLGRAGLTMGQQLAAVEPIVLASKAMLTDLEETTEGIINIIRAFNYTFEDTAKIVGQVTYAANKSTQSLDDILIALSYAGKPAQAANTSFQQLAAALSIVANQGIRGSKAGVAMRFAFTSLMRPTKETTDILQKYNIQVYNSEFRMKQLPDLLEEIENGLAGLTEKRRNEAIATIVGTRATSTWLALLSQGNGAVREWTENIDKAGNEAEDVARLQLKALLERWGLLKKQIQAVVYALVDQFSPGLKAATDNLTELAKKTEEWIKANKDNVKEMVKSVANLGLLAAKVGLVLLLLPKLINFSGAIISALTSPLILAVAAIYGLSVVFRDELTNMYNAIKKFWDDSSQYSETGASKLSNKIANILPGEWGERVRTGMAAARYQQYGVYSYKPAPLGLKMKMPGQNEKSPFASYFDAKKNKWMDTIKSDFESMKKLIGGVAESILPAEALAGWEELKKIIDDLTTALGKTQEGFEKTGEAATDLGKTLGEITDPRGDWFKFLQAWDDAKKTITGNLLTIQETAEGVVMGMTDAFSAGMSEWMQGGWSLVGAFKDIFRRIYIAWTDLIAQITVNSIMKSIFGLSQENAITWGRVGATFIQGGGASGIWNKLFGGSGTGNTQHYPGLGDIGGGGSYENNRFDMSDYENNRFKPAISFNITNEIPGAELEVISAETQADRTVLNAVYRLAGSNTMFRRTFVNPGGR